MGRANTIMRQAVSAKNRNCLAVTVIKETDWGLIIAPTEGVNPITTNCVTSHVIRGAIGRKGDIVSPKAVDSQVGLTRVEINGSRGGETCFVSLGRRATYRDGRRS